MTDVPLSSTRAHNLNGTRDMHLAPTDLRSTRTPLSWLKCGVLRTATSATRCNCTVAPAIVQGKPRKFCKTKSGHTSSTLEVGRVARSMLSRNFVTAHPQPRRALTRPGLSALHAPLSKNPASLVAALVAVLGLKTVEIPATQHLTTHGSRASMPAKKRL